MAAHNELEKKHEHIAADYLESNGWYIRHSNWGFSKECHGIVCIDTDMTFLLFVIICNHKEGIKKYIDDIISAASDYIQDYHLEHLPIRFDRLVINDSDNEHIVIHEENILPSIDPYTFYEQLRDKQRLITKINNNGRT